MKAVELEPTAMDFSFPGRPVYMSFRGLIQTLKKNLEAVHDGIPTQTLGLWSASQQNSLCTLPNERAGLRPAAGLFLPYFSLRLGDIVQAARSRAGTRFEAHRNL